MFDFCPCDCTESDEPDPCSYQTGGSHLSPPEYCDEEAEPGEDYCTRHREMVEQLERLCEQTTTTEET